MSSPHPQGDAAAGGTLRRGIASQPGCVTALTALAIICFRSLFALAIGIDKQSCHLRAGRNIALTSAELKPS